MNAEETRSAIQDESAIYTKDQQRLREIGRLLGREDCALGKVRVVPHLDDLLLDTVILLKSIQERLYK